MNLRKTGTHTMQPRHVRLKNSGVSQLGNGRLVKEYVSALKAFSIRLGKLAPKKRLVLFEFMGKGGFSIAPALVIGRVARLHRLSEEHPTVPTATFAWAIANAQTALHDNSHNKQMRLFLRLKHRAEKQGLL